MFNDYLKFLYGHARVDIPYSPSIMPIEGSLVSVVGIVCLLIASLFWLYKDASKRNLNGWLAVLLFVVTGWPVSLVLWIWLRPSICVTAKSKENANKTVH